MSSIERRLELLHRLAEHPATSKHEAEAARHRIDVIKREHYAAPPPDPILGLRLLFARGGKRRPCCSDIIVVHLGKGPHAPKLCCEKCGKTRDWMPKKAAVRLRQLLRDGMLSELPTITATGFKLGKKLAA
jgi:hypothetical protein